MSRFKYLGVDKYPDQDNTLLNKKVVVMLGYDSKRPQRGRVLRADASAPSEVVIQLDDKRIVLGSECSFKVAIEADG
ncbi:hypothetical protein [Reinekea sp.]|jgi:hypothetical protein|uniref:hypothetical protein n=2 Tax=Reinekea sp. TaxID=1970455 RepID=UPI0039895D8E